MTLHPLFLIMTILENILMLVSSARYNQLRDSMLKENSLEAHSILKEWKKEIYTYIKLIHLRHVSKKILVLRWFKTLKSSSLKGSKICLFYVFILVVNKQLCQHFCQWLINFMYLLILFCFALKNISKWNMLGRYLCIRSTNSVSLIILCLMKIYKIFFY